MLARKASKSQQSFFKRLTSFVSALGPAAMEKLPVLAPAAVAATKCCAIAAATWLDASVRDVTAGAGAKAPGFPARAAAA